MIKPILLIVSLAVFLPASSVFAQDRFEKLQQRWEKRWDDVKPKGKLIQQLVDSVSGDKEDKEQQPKPSQQFAPAAVQEPRVNAYSSATQSPAFTTDNWRQRNDGNQRSRNDQPSSRRNTASPNQTPSIQQPPAFAQTAPVSNAASGVTFGVAIDEKKSDKNGLWVDQVAKGSPAALADIQSGDRIAAMAGLEMTSLQSLDDLLGALSPGDQVMVELLRKNKSVKTLVSFGDANVTLPADRFDADGSFSYSAPTPPDVLNGSPHGDASGLIQDLPSVLDRNLQAPATNKSNYPAPSALPAITGSSVRQSTSTTPVINGASTAPSQQQLLEEIRRQREIIDQLQQKLQQYRQENSESIDLLPLSSPDGK